MTGKRRSARAGGLGGVLAVALLTLAPTSADAQSPALAAPATAGRPSAQVARATGNDLATPGLGWGDGNDGQLAGSTGRLPGPIPVLLPPATVSVALGRRHSLALTADGAVYSWGADSASLLGAAAGPAPAAGPAFRRVAVPEGTVVTAIATDSGHSLALSDRGAVYSWGANRSGELGDGGTAARQTVAAVAGLPAIAAIATGEHHSVAVSTDGRVYTWGANDTGQLGHSGGGSAAPLPVALPDGTRAVEAAAGARFTLVRTADGRVLAWGANSDGQLGDGSRIGRSSAGTVLLPTDQRATHIAAGGSGAVVVTERGQAWSWGDNSLGQVGDATTTDRSVPVAVPLPGGATAVDLSRAGDHTLVRTADRRLFAWGDNRWGQLGDGTTTTRSTPTVVDLPPGDDIVAMGAGFGQDLAAVASNGLDRLTVATSTPVITPAMRAEFRVDGFDDQGHWLGPVTTGVTLAIDDGTCEGMSCRSDRAGERAVTATVGSAVGRTFLRVTSSGSGPSTTASPTDDPDPSTTPPPSTTPGTTTTTTPSPTATAGGTTTRVSSTALVVPTADRPVPGTTVQPVDPPAFTRATGVLSSTGVGPWLFPALLAAVAAVATGTVLVVVSRRRHRTAPEGEPQS
ncbi:hypothetical protein FDO65_11975 [Nakamurella flava]|uniref:RCC1-like domain-containing protein n=1 Tax=Nakamurella flava TaxID=2576308 RepID=A0A4U6QEB4_9ACTN|nr:RCC1 domain-containing protein [Nakamurella flava]TKV58299.1 hypothetical protein FDO65_11975 [Nakamurella flava]